jgi:hypothetical protein
MLKPSFSILENNSIVEIRTTLFWEKTMDWYKEEFNHGIIPSLNKLKTQKVTKKLGLHFLDVFLSEDGRSFFQFEIVDKQLFLLTMFKYGF